MKPRTSGLLVLILFAVPAALAAVSASSDGSLGDPIEGQKLFVGKGCVRCHAVRGAGGRVGPDLGRKVIRGSYSEIAAVMWNHSPSMLGRMNEYRIHRPTFENSELSDLVAFLFLLNYFDEPGDPRTGQTLFTEKHCLRCHRVGEEGGSTGPALDTIPRSLSPLQIAQSLWNHRPAMVSAMAASGLEVPTFAGNEILDLISYVRSHGMREAGQRFQSLGDPDEGREVFEAKGCGLCHTFFGDEMDVGPDLGRMELREGVTRIAGRMWNHWPVMAEMMEKTGMTVPEFVDDELTDLFAYLYIARYQGEPGDPAQGAITFEEKGCVACHGPDGKGLIVEKDLRAATEGKPREAIMQSMWNHAPQMGGMLSERRLSWPRLTAEEITDVLDFLSGGWSAGDPRSKE